MIFMLRSNHVYRIYRVRETIFFFLWYLDWIIFFLIKLSYHIYCRKKLLFMTIRIFFSQNLRSERNLLLYYTFIFRSRISVGNIRIKMNHIHSTGEINTYMYNFKTQHVSGQESRISVTAEFFLAEVYVRVVTSTFIYACETGYDSFSTNPARSYPATHTERRIPIRQ